MDSAMHWPATRLRAPATSVYGLLRPRPLTAFLVMTSSLDETTASFRDREWDCRRVCLTAIVAQIQRALQWIPALA